MNKVFFTLLFLVFICYNPGDLLGQSNIKIQVRVIKKLSPEIHNRFGGTFYSVKIDIFNNTDSVIRFWTMCGWQINWTSNNENLILFPGPNNDKDYTLIQQINSGQKLSYRGGEINIKGNLNDIQKENFKLGLILVLEKEMNEDSYLFNFYDLIHKKKQQNIDIIWSEPFKINK
jgi:hypothetical protein